jgi:hypothetical protein
MLDLLHLPKSTPGNVDYIYNTGGTTSWQTWEKPRGIIMLEIICIGAGGGGRSGWCANTTRSGGGGGGSGGFSRLLIPAIFLPDVLYVSVGRGGAGGAHTTVSGTANAGSDGSFSSVNIAPTNSAFYIVCYANAGAGAVLGTSSAGTAGVGAAVAVQTTALMSNLGIFSALAGQSGGAGNTAVGGGITYPTTGLLLSGGAAGGGGNISSGGNITAPTYASFALVPTRTAGIVSAAGGAGADGITLFQPLMSIGGAGGGASNSVTTGTGYGGRGGNGGLGCGGGGGGSGPLSGAGPGGIGGSGGKGGDGLVIIRSW